MTNKQFDRMVDGLADKYSLSAQLTAAWLRNEGLDKRAFGLSKQQFEELCKFARV